MNELALFAGAGGGLLGSKLLGWRIVCYVEKNQYCHKVLQARIADGFIDDAPIWDNVRTFDGNPWAGCVDIITAGFPCQPFSRAGKRLGEHDKRNLWPDTIRIIREVEPEWLLLENVTRLLCITYFGRILADLAESGFDVRWDCIPASALGAPHQRDRLWIVAHAHNERRATTLQHKSQRKCNAPSESGGNGKIQFVAYSDCDKQQLYKSEKQGEISVRSHSYGSGQDVADPDGSRFEEYTQLDGEPKDNPADRRTSGGYIGRCSDEMADSMRDGLEKQRDGESTIVSPTNGWWAIEPPLGRMANGVANRVGQLEAIGQGQVPAVVRAAWMLLSEGL